MNTKVIATLIGIVIIAGTGGLVYLKTSARTSPNTGQSAEQTFGGTPDETNGAGERFSAAEVAAHNTATDCWSIINGSVYDLTEWITRHPGGQQAVLQLCGRDGSEEFNRQHGGAPPQEQMLATFRIGELAE